LSEGSGDTSEFISGFQELGFTIDDNELDFWLRSDNNNPGFQIMTDEDIWYHCFSESPQSEKEEEEELKKSYSCLVTHSRAAHMFDECLTWLKCQPEATIANTAMLPKRPPSTCLSPKAWKYETKKNII